MASRPAAQLELDLPQEVREERPAARAETPRRARPAEARRSRPRRLRLWAAAAVLVIVAVIAALAFYHVDQFLASDPRFTLTGEAQSPRQPGLRLEGAVNVSRAKLRQVFARDFGRSVYLMPLEARRRELLAVDWVREARLERHWPNRIVARIAERTPVAFVLLPAAAGAASHTALIDAEGVILDPPARGRFAFPVLLGLSSAQPRDLRRQKVETFLRFQQEAGRSAALISEVDLGDPENLKVTLLVEGVPARLWMGNANWRARLQNFLDNYAEIRRLLPTAAAFDLRLDRHITAMKEAPRGR
jgi:cell division protein FtsQ